MVNYQEHFDTLTTDEVFSGQLFTNLAMVLLPDATPLIGQIHPSRFRHFVQYFITQRDISNRLGVAAP